MPAIIQNTELLLQKKKITFGAVTKICNFKRLNLAFTTGNHGIQSKIK
jgi:hypothetical protein